MKILILFLILVPVSVYWNNDTEVSSLESYDRQIIELQAQKEQLNTSWEEFRTTHGSITDFIKEDLSDTEKKSLSSIVETYLAELRINREDISVRKIFFNDIAEFINTEKIELFEQYIAMSVHTETERQQLTGLIRELKDQKQARTDMLRTQIADNANTRRLNIKQRIEPLLRERLDTFVETKGFQNLPNERKALVFWRILWRIQIQQSQLELSEVKTTVILDRIETYKVIEAIMLEYINLWR